MLATSVLTDFRHSLNLKRQKEYNIYSFYSVHCTIICSLVYAKLGLPLQVLLGLLEQIKIEIKNEINSNLNG